MIAHRIPPNDVHRVLNAYREMRLSAGAKTDACSELIPRDANYMQMLLSTRLADKTACKHECQNASVAESRTLVGPMPGQAESSSMDACMILAAVSKVLPSVSTSVLLTPRTVVSAAFRRDR